MVNISSFTKLPLMPYLNVNMCILKMLGTTKLMNYQTYINISVLELNENLELWILHCLW